MKLLKICMLYLALSFIEASADIDKATGNSIKTETEAIDKIEDPVTKVLKYLDLALVKMAERPTVLGPIYRNVPPPKNSGIMPGSDPSVIDDPRVRKEYKILIEKNREKILKSNESQRLVEEAIGIVSKAKTIATHEIKGVNKKILLSIISQMEILLSKHPKRGL